MLLFQLGKSLDLLRSCHLPLKPLLELLLPFTLLGIH
jgi:hypothetical protein